jgi:hypothetical protein
VSKNDCCNLQIARLLPIFTKKQAMKNFLIAMLLFTGVTYLSSCSYKVDGTTNSLIVPPADSVSINSNVVTYYNNDTFNIHDLTVKNLPIESISASNTYNPADSIWATTIVLTDYTKTEISLNLTAYRDSANPVGIYVVNTNSSTFTDFSTGQNRTYSVMEWQPTTMKGSSITLTQTHPITGTFSLLLLYNNDTIPATGTFLIYN